jgi:hypothetical protein
MMPVTVPWAATCDARAIAPAIAEILVKDMAQVASRICAQRDGDSSELSKDICRLQSMKRIFKFEKGRSTANCNERDERTFKFEKGRSSASCNDRDEKNGSVADENFQKALEMLYICKSWDEQQR